MINDIEKEDWIIIRLLYLTLAIDPTMVKVKDVDKTLDYIKHKYPQMHIMEAFDLLKKEHGSSDTFNQIGVASFRYLPVNVKRDYADDEEKEFMQRRVFGISKQEHSSGVIQDIVDKMNETILRGLHDRR
jgi:hypothetical protein